MATEKTGDRNKSVLEDKEKFQDTGGDKDQDAGAKEKIAHMGDEPNTAQQPSGKRNPTTS
jgi:hypothetical protein